VGGIEEARLDCLSGKRRQQTGVSIVKGAHEQGDHLGPGDRRPGGHQMLVRTLENAVLEKCRHDLGLVRVAGFRGVQIPKVHGHVPHSDTEHPYQEHAELRAKKRGLSLEHGSGGPGIPGGIPFLPQPLDGRAIKLTRSKVDERWSG